MPSDSIAETDAIFARAYASAICNKFGLKIGPRQAIFVCPVVQRGIAAGKLIYPEMTNYLVKALSDALLPADNPSYTGGSAGSYLKQLRSYMEHIETKRDVTQVVQNRMGNARENLADAIVEQEQARAAAKIRFAGQKEDYPGWTFIRWALSHAPDYNVATRTVQSAEAEFFTASQLYYGPDATTIVAYLKKVQSADQANEQAVQLPGITMPGLLDDKDLLANAQKKANSGKELPKDEIAQSIVQVPAYIIAGNYSSTLQDWIDQAGVSRKRTQTLSLDISNGRDTKWEDFGFKKATGGGSVGLWPFFSVNVNYNSGTQTQTLDTKNKEDQISLEISMIAIQRFDVRPGEWDVAGVKTLFPKQLPDSPKVLTSDVVQVTSILVGYDVALKVTFGSAMREQVNKMYEDVKKYGGGLRIFGFDVSAGGGGSSEERVETKFEDTKWDSTKGTLTLEPSAGQVYPTILAVLGQRFED